MRTSRFVVAIWIASALLAAGQNIAPDWKAPSQAADRKNPLKASPDLVAGGRKIFLRECAQCHGEKGEGGRRKHAPDLTGAATQELTDGELFWMITNGNPRHDMPPWSRLPELQRWQLVLFLRTLATDESSARE
jgi:mono/diheme cytochrome c family protein